MKTIELNLYKFNELSPKAQQKAIESSYETNVNYDWWDCTYDDAKRIGLKISQFDTYGRTIDIEFTEDAEDVADAMLKEWGQGTDMYFLADYYKRNLKELRDKQTFDEYGDSDSDDDIEELNSEFLHRLGKEFLSMLINEYEWRTSDDAIIESIECNDYYFTKDGTIY